MTKPTIETSPGAAVRLHRFVRRFRRINWWLDSNLWFRIGMWTGRFDVPDTRHHLLMGLHEFAWAKFCGYGFRHAWRMGMIYWRPSNTQVERPANKPKETV
jgi:hypothetical protein